MKDIPLFTTDFGLASLILKEIPYRGEAYIRILDVQPRMLEDHLKECIAFCRMAGAEHIYAAGHEELAQYPLYTSIYEMRGGSVAADGSLANLFPVTEETVSRWREIYNRRMRNVDCAATKTAFDEKQIVSSGGAYFVHDNGDLLGIGLLEDNALLAVCSAKQGAGFRVMQTLMSLVEEGSMHLEVASTNYRAIRLYERLGFVTVGEKQRWYKIL